ncbi:basic blue-like protein [Cinnamomum micranthum f. kanehirae]|uniref:Plantacyanin n=1 Tax=Cinnamomum micranthum f. kanehirae TaxID=337451 RepID=A0A443N8X4_9MAGN|nr:basic blue-like protein [Cinnamomum micranthum f. kanehirae]
MMAQGIGSAQKWLVIGVTLLFLSDIAQAATYTVGDKGGWSFNLVNWPKGKSFKAGDVLMFKYNPTIHNVVAVNRNGYNGCTTPRGSKVYRTGNDNIKLVKGQNYFICNIVGHCQAGMKISINAV